MRKSIFEIMGEAVVLPAICPNGAKMAFGWPTGRNYFFQHTWVRCDTQKSFHFSLGANQGGFGLFRHAGKSLFKILGQPGVMPVLYPNSAKMALG